MKKKKTPIIYATRISWARFRRINPQTGQTQTRLVQLWQEPDGTLRLYLGTVRMDLYTFHDVCDTLLSEGWCLVQGVISETGC